MARQKDSLYTGKAINRIRSIAFKLSRYARRTILLGTLSYSMRRNLSKFISLIICAIPQYIKNILVLERLFLAKSVNKVII